MACRRSTRRSRALVVILSVVLIPSFAAWHGSPAVAVDAVQTSTTVEGPGTATVGVATTLTAQVLPPDAPGTVQFRIGNVALGDRVAVDDHGVASLPYTFTSEGTMTVTADFSSTDPTFLPSEDQDGWEVVVQPASAPLTPTTTVVTAPGTATVGTATALVATVSPASAGGTMQFSVDGSPVGSPVTVDAGAASTPYTFTSGGAHTVGAVFTPTDATTYAGSADADGLAVTLLPGATTTEVTAPTRATAGRLAILAASVHPVDAAGQVTFVVDGVAAGTADVVAGTATASYVFPAAGASSVVASFEPTETGSYESSVATVRTVEVAAGVTAVSLPALLPMPTFTLPLPGSCAGGRTAGAGSGKDPIEDLVHLVLGVYLDAFNDLADEALGLRSSFLSFVFSGTLCRRAVGKHAADKTVHGTVPCLLTDDGYSCPFDLPAFSELTISGSVPMPAVLAGQRVKVGTALSSVDPGTGAQTTLASDQATIRVPRRTVLSAKFSPAKRSVTSVRRGHAVTYRLAVRNAGVVTADHVRACVSLGKDARIRTARGAEVRGRTACWTLPPLRKGDQVVRSLTVVAPRTKGDLGLDVVVRPRRTQASVVRLTAMLPVR